MHIVFNLQTVAALMVVAFLLGILLGWWGRRGR